MNKRFSLKFSTLIVLSAVSLFASVPKMLKTSSRLTPVAQTANALSGQSMTLLPNGDLLILGGRTANGSLFTASIRSAQTGVTTPLRESLHHARYGHTATLLPDGTVIVLGGIGTNDRIEERAELFDPSTQQFADVSSSGLLPRVYHTATVLTDGRVLVAGGLSDTGDTLASIETWDFRTRSSTNLSSILLVARSKHTSTLLPDGTVLFWGGVDKTDSALNFGEIFDPVTQQTRMQMQLPASNETPALEASIPEDEATNVPVSSLLAMRFSKPLSVVTVNPQTVNLSGPQGSVDAKVIPAEGGTLAFVTPNAALLPGTAYTISLSGPTDGTNALDQTMISFNTAGTAPDSAVVPEITGSDPDDTGNQAFNSPWLKLPPLEARTGVTAISGQVLRLNGLPLANVTLKIGNQSVETDQTGRFLLPQVLPGHQVMLIDGRTASQKDGSYGVYEDGVDAVAGQTYTLPYTIWMTRIDTADATRIPSPTTSPDTTVTTPQLPGLELHLPQNTVIYDNEWKVSREISITEIPINKPPFPLPAGVQVPIYFTIQPGAGYVKVNDPTDTYKGATLVYPNTYQFKPGTVFNFWNYDADQKGWYVYGQGKVSADGRSVVPNTGVEIHEFTGAMVGAPSVAKPQGPTADPAPSGGEPVDLSSGLFIYKKTDLVVPDVIPIVLQRTYTANDSAVRMFGKSTMQDYDMFLVGDVTTYSYLELCLPDGSRMYFYRTSSGTTYGNAVYAHTSSNSKWYGATITFNASTMFSNADWVLTTRDGTNYYFPNGIGQSSTGKMALLGITDRYGNLLTVARDSSGNITQITSPNQRYITFTHDSSNRITQATDNIGRTVSYTYDSGGHLSTVTDANSGVTTFTYDSNDNMLTVEDARSITYLTNQYDTNGRVTKQTMADGSTYQFAWTPATATVLTNQISFGSSSYTSPGGSASIVTGFRACSSCSEGYLPLVSQVDVTDPNGVVREVTFGSTGQTATDTYAHGTASAQTFTYTYFADNLLASVTDPLSRETTYAYDANGNITQTTRLAGTGNAVATSFTYDPTFSQLASATDGLSHTTSYSIDSNGNTTAITDPLGHQTSLTYNAQGQVTGITDPLSHTTQFQYDGGDLVSITDPLGRTAMQFHDGAGRLLASQNPFGQTTRYTYDALNEVLTITDPLSGQTSFSYDANGNRTGVTDAKSNTTMT